MDSAQQYSDIPAGYTVLPPQMPLASASPQYSDIPDGYSLLPSITDRQQASRSFNQVTRPAAPPVPSPASPSLSLGPTPQAPRSVAEGLTTEEQERRGGMPLAIQPASGSLANPHPEQVVPVPRATTTLSSAAQPSVAVEEPPAVPVPTGRFTSPRVTPEQAQADIEGPLGIKTLTGARGYPEMAAGFKKLVPTSLQPSPSAKQLETGATEVLKGATTAATPLMVVGSLLQPEAAALAGAGAAAGGTGARKLAEAFHASPEARDLAEQAGQIAGGFAGGAAFGGLRHLADPENALTDLLWKRGYVQDNEGKPIYITSQAEARAVAQEILRQNPQGLIQSALTKMRAARAAENVPARIDMGVAEEAPYSDIPPGYKVLPPAPTEEKPVHHASNDVEDLRASAERQAPAVGDAVAKAAEAVPGAKLEAVRDSKDSDRIADKAERQNVQPSQVGDVLATKVTVPDQNAANEVLANLHKELPVESVNGAVSGEAGKNGVRQTQAIVHTNAPVGEPVKKAEVILQTPEMAKATDETHDDYRKAQELRAQGKVAEAKAIEDQISEKHEAAEQAAKERLAENLPPDESQSPAAMEALRKLQMGEELSADEKAIGERQAKRGERLQNLSPQEAAKLSERDYQRWLYTRSKEQITDPHVIEELAQAAIARGASADQLRGITNRATYLVEDPSELLSNGAADTRAEANRLAAENSTANAKMRAAVSTVEETIAQRQGEPNALREPSPGSLLQRPQEETGARGGERGRVEPGIRGQEVAAASAETAQPRTSQIVRGPGLAPIPPNSLPHREPEYLKGQSVEVRDPQSGQWKQGTVLADVIASGPKPLRRLRGRFADGTEFDNIKPEDVRKAQSPTPASGHADVGVDFDGTLFTQTNDGSIGKPIPARIQSVKDLLAQGKTVQIETRRVQGRPEEVKKIQDALESAGLPRLPVTDQKTAKVLFDNEAHHAPTNENTPLVAPKPLIKGNPQASQPPAPSDLDNPHPDKALYQALHGFSGSQKRWDALVKSGATDEQIKRQIAQEFGIAGGATSYGGYDIKGGDNPRFWHHPTAGFGTSGKPTLQGNALVQRVRDLLEIPEPSQGETKPAKTETTSGVSETKPEQPKYKFGSTQVNIPSDSEASKAIEAARARISGSDLAGQGKEIGEGGNHVTVRYGIQGDDTTAIRKFLSQQSPFEATLGKTEKFPVSEHSEGAAPIIAPIEAPELHRINREIEKHGEFSEPSFDEYKPHATIAYVDPAKADRYAGMDVTHGKKFTVNEIAITDKQGNQDVVKLEGKAPRPERRPGQAPVPPAKKAADWKKGDVVTFTKVAPGSYLKPNESYMVEHASPKSVQFRNPRTGAGTSDSVKMLTFAEYTKEPAPTAPKPPSKKELKPAIPKEPKAAPAPTSEDFLKRFESDRDGYVSHYLETNSRNGIVYISADRARSLFPEYAESAKGASDNTVATNKAASSIASAAFDKAITSGAVKDKQVLFVAGMPGAGKSSAENAMANKPETTAMIYEGNLSDPALLERRVKAVLDAGGYPTVVYVSTPPKIALERMIGRADKIGRYVPIEYGAKVAANTPRSIEALNSKYPEKVEYFAIDNGGKPGEGKLEAGIDAIRRMADNRSSDDIRAEQVAHADHLRKAGKLSDELHSKIYPSENGGASGTGNAGQHQEAASGPLAPGKVGEMKISDLKVAPHKFQYKLGTDAAGTSTLLKETKVFNPDLAGVISVWRDPADGNFYVVNGHHRYELANRTGQPTVTVRHIVAPTANAARAIGALQNIAEGRGTAIDAAKFFHDSQPKITSGEQLKEKGISLGEKTASDGLAMSRLDPSIFAKVISGELRQGRAVAIGEATTDPAEQKAVLSMVERKERAGKKVSDETLSELIRLVKSSGQITEATASLFGTQEINRSLALEKAEISAHIKQQLAKDKKLFGFVSKGDRATELERGGNKIDVDKSKEISTGAAQAEEVYNRLSERGGPIAAILDESARKLADGESSATAKSDAYNRVRAEISKTLGTGVGSGTGRPEGTPETPETNLTKVPASQLTPGDTFVDEDGEPRRVIAVEGDKIRTADGTLKTYTGEITKLGPMNSRRALLARGGMFHPVGLSDEELQEWSKAKGFRVEQAGEQLGMFGGNEPVLRVFRAGRGGKEQKALVYQSQLDQLNEPAPQPNEPFTLTGGESREKQPGLFGAGDLGEIIGNPKAERGIKLPSKERETGGGLFSGESGTFTPSKLHPAHVRQQYDKAVDEFISGTLKIGDKYHAIAKDDETIANSLHLIDNAPRYFKAKAEANVNKVIAGLNDDQIRLASMMADSDSRDYLKASQPDEYKAAMQDPKIQAALSNFEPLQQELAEDRIALGWPVRKSLHVEEDPTVDSANPFIVKDREGNSVESFKSEAKAMKYADENGEIEPHLKRTYPEHSKSPLPAETGAGDFVGSYVHDKGLRPPRIDKKSREMSAAYHYEHGRKDFSGYLESFKQVKTALMKQQLFDDFTAKAEPWTAGTAQPPKIEYNGKTYYRPDLAAKAKEGKENLPAYAIYDPTRGEKFLMMNPDPENGWATLATGKKGIKATDRFLGPKSVVDAMENYDASRGGEAGSLRKWFQTQIVGLFGPVVHINNIVRRIGQATGLGTFDPRSWPSIARVIASPELRARVLKGVDDATIDMLARQGAYTDWGDIGSANQYIGGNLNPSNWIRSFGKGVLFDPKFLKGWGGLDPKARVIVADYFKDHFPQMTDAEVAKAVEDGFGNYNRANWTERQRLLAKFTLFPGWDTASAKWFLRHPFRVGVAGALVTLAINRALHALGKNKDEDSSDLAYIHIGDRKLSSGLISDNMGNHVMSALGITGALQAKLNDEDVSAGATEGAMRGFSALAGTLSGPAIEMVADQIFNRKYAGGASELVTPEDKYTPGTWAPNRELEKRIAFAALKGTPALSRFIDNQGHWDWAQGLGGAVFGVTNYKYGAEERFKANVAKAATYGQALSQLAEKNPEAAAEFVKDPTKATYLMFHDDLESMARDLKEIDAQMERVRGADIPHGDRQQALEDLKDNRNELLKAADGLNDALQGAKREARKSQAEYWRQAVAAGQ